MSNQAQMDYDRQFQEDLAKATALSLEQQALDDYRRNKKYGSGNADYYVQQQQQQQQRRRHSEVHQVVAPVSNVDRSRTPPAGQTGNGESDLISFASPTGKQPTPESGSTFERLIEDLHRMHTNNPQSALVPVGPVAAATPVPVHYAAPNSMPVHYAPPPAAAYGSVPPGGMQLVPYQQQQPQQRPLNHEELQRLYSMPNQLALQPVAPTLPAGFVYYPTFTAPVVPGSAAFMPPQYPSHGFGYGVAGYAPNNGGSTHVDFARPHSTPAAAAPPATFHPNTSSSSSSSVSSNNHSHPVAHSVPGTPAASSVSFNARRSSPPVGSRPSVGPPLPAPRTGNDLIDLNQDDYTRVSVLEAFDPLLNENTVSQK